MRQFPKPKAQGPKPKRTERILAAFALSLCATACAGSSAPCFAQSSLVLDTRVLAVRVDPPESVVDLSDASSIVSSSISALVVKGVVNQLLQFGIAVEDPGHATTVRVCLTPTVSQINAEPGCPADSLVIAQLDAVPTIHASLSYAPPLALLQQALAQDPVHGLAGIQLRLELSFATPNGPIIASKMLSYQLKGSPLGVNHGLDLVGMETSNGGQHDSRPSGVAIDLLVAQANGLRPLIGPGPGGATGAEDYLAYDNGGHLVSLHEHVTYSFYAGNSIFFGEPLSSSGEAIYNGAPGDVADEPEPGADPPDGLVSAEPVFTGNQSGSFWVIARDGRGAVAWANIPYSAKDLRPCAGMTNAYGGGVCPTIFFGCN